MKVKEIIYKIIKYGIFGTGLSMIFFVIVFLTNTEIANPAMLALWCLLIGFLIGSLYILNDYLNLFFFLGIHFSISYTLVIILMMSFQIITSSFISAFYTFEIIFTVYVCYTSFLYYRNILNGISINKKIGVVNKDDNYIYLGKVLLIIGSLWNIMPDLIITIISSLLILVGFIIILTKHIKTKYAHLSLVFSFLSLFCDMFLLISTIKVINSGGNVSIGIFNGLLVEVVSLSLLLCIFIMYILYLHNKKKQPNITEN